MKELDLIVEGPQVSYTVPGGSNLPAVLSRATSEGYSVRNVDQVILYEDDNRLETTAIILERTRKPGLEEVAARRGASLDLRSSKHGEPYKGTNIGPTMPFSEAQQLQRRETLTDQAVIYRVESNHYKFAKCQDRQIPK